ncbi:hypothetical protein ABH931_005963 [Streptacidiphilus sp. MAP12-33]|uniref:hypothetical protein n=1 Tax=Streptacidiphilus sp. MAP12-33 TaxID=3156266 RepID=UPI0035163FF2
MTVPFPFDLDRPREPWVLFARRNENVVQGALSAFAAGGGRIHRFRAGELRDERALHPCQL